MSNFPLRLASGTATLQVWYLLFEQACWLNAISLRFSTTN